MDQSRAQGQLKGEELRRLFKELQHIPAAVAILDNRFRYVMVSRRWMSEFGLESQALRGRAHFDFFYDEEEYWHGIFAQGLRGNVVRGNDTLLARRGGETYWVRWEVRPWYRKKNVVGGFILFAENKTEQRQAEAALRESEQRFRALFDSMFQFLGLMKPDGTLIEVNQTALDFGGLALADCIGRPFWACPWWSSAPEAQAELRAAVERAAGGAFVRYTVEMQGAGGRVAVVDFSIKPIRDEHGAVGLLILEGRDVTEQSQAEQALRERELQLLRAQRLAHLGSWEWNVQTGELTWSDELYRIYGLEPGAGLTLEVFVAHVHPDDRAPVQQTIEGALHTLQSFSFYHRILRSDGAERILHSEGEVLTDANGVALKMLGTGRDVTEAWQAEVGLRRSEERFRLLAENMTDLVALHDPDGSYIYLSPSVARILGFKPADLIGTPFFDLIHPDDAAHVREEVDAQGCSGSTFWQSTLRMRTSSSEADYLWLDMTIRFIRDAHGAVVRLQSSARDVTERVWAERELARSHAALRQRNRELQDFTYVASHDLQEPLRKIRAFADLMREDYSEAVDEAGRYYLQRMQEAATRMSRLIADLLAFSRVSTKAQPFEPVDLNQIAADVISDLEVLISEVDGQVQIDALPTLDADPTQMRQLLQNLIGNALKFHNDGVPPVVCVSSLVQPAETNPSEQVCILQVADNGIGFDEKYLDRIFTPFKRLHGRDKFTGTGMGLAICRRIAERHYGTITARSTPGEGSTFIVTLPIRQEEPEERNDS